MIARWIRYDPCCYDLSRNSYSLVTQVIIVVSSLRSLLGPFNDCLRAMHLLDCKGGEYFAIDVNADIGPDSPDKALILRWRHLHWIYRDPHKTKTKTKKDVVVPQILIDGIPIGGLSDLQMLEEDNDLGQLMF